LFFFNSTQFVLQTPLRIVSVSDIFYFNARQMYEIHKDVDIMYK